MLFLLHKYFLPCKTHVALFLRFCIFRKSQKTKQN